MTGTEYIIFTDNWWNWFIHEYAYTMGIVWALLKAIAILDPTNKTNKVLDSFRSLIPGGGKELARRAEDKKTDGG